jgi:hypothetical protein
MSSEQGDLSNLSSIPYGGDAGGRGVRGLTRSCSAWVHVNLRRGGRATFITVISKRFRIDSNPFKSTLLFLSPINHNHNFSSSSNYFFTMLFTLHAAFIDFISKRSIIDSHRVQCIWLFVAQINHNSSSSSTSSLVIPFTSHLLFINCISKTFKIHSHRIQSNPFDYSSLKSITIPHHLQFLPLSPFHIASHFFFNCISKTFKIHSHRIQSNPFEPSLLRSITIPRSVALSAGSPFSNIFNLAISIDSGNSLSPVKAPYCQSASGFVSEL